MSTAAFYLIPIALLLLFLWAAARSRVSLKIAAPAAMLWMAGTYALAASGTLRDWTRRPPPFGLVMLAMVILALALALGPAGRKIVQSIPLWALIAVQSFRLPLELAMHDMYERGIMPEQMSYSGRNFDILTGITAILVAAVVYFRRTPVLAWIWNIAGLGLLLNVVIVALLSTPLIRYFGDDALNTWVADAPYIWLPAVMVLAALAGHLIIFRALTRRNHDMLSSVEVSRAVSSR